jgi:hypothetical protein
MVDAKISEAWREASARLGIRVTAPFELRVADAVIAVEAFLPDFGGTKGALLFAITEDEEDTRASDARPAGLYISQLGTDYQQFDEELFRITLDDWGWYDAADQKPSWYEGR